MSNLEKAIERQLDTMFFLQALNQAYHACNRDWQAVKQWRDDDCIASLFIGDDARSSWPSVPTDAIDSVIELMEQSKIQFAKDAEQAVEQMKDVLRRAGVVTLTVLKRGKDF